MWVKHSTVSVMRWLWASDVPHSMEDFFSEVVCGYNSAEWVAGDISGFNDSTICLDFVFQVSSEKPSEWIKICTRQGLLHFPKPLNSFLISIWRTAHRKHGPDTLPMRLWQLYVSLLKKKERKKRKYPSLINIIQYWILAICHIVLENVYISPLWNGATYVKNMQL